MLSPAVLPQVPRLAAWSAGAALALAGSLAMLLAEPAGPEVTRFRGVPRVELPLPAPVATPARRDSTAGEPPALAPGLGATDPALVEPGPFGPVPRIAPDGRSPLVAYAGRAEPADPRPKLAILLVGLGLQDALSRAALALPAAISLGFSPHAPDLATWAERTRAAGHEVFLDLPMAPADFPESDPGPRSLRPDLAPAVNRERLLWVLGRAQGYAGVIGSGGSFAGSERAAAVLRELATRGLGLVEPGTAQLAPGAAAANLPYANLSPPIDRDPAPLAIDYALAALEAQALETGSAAGVAQLYPVTLERLRAWAATLEDKGLALVPVGALLAARAGLLPVGQPDGTAGRARG